MSQAPRPVTGTEWLRRANTAAVLRSLRHDGPASRSELAERTGLAKATVGAIAAELESCGAVAECPDASLSGAGRVAETARGLAGRRLAGVTVGVPGLVQADDRTVAWAPNLRLDDPRLAELVGGVLGREHDGPVPAVRVLNDANCAAYAETRRGAAAGVAHALYLTGTIGIGAGVVIDGRLLRGAAGFAGEVGHLPLGPRSWTPRSSCWGATSASSATSSSSPPVPSSTRGCPRPLSPGRSCVPRASGWSPRPREPPSGPGTT